MNVSVKWNSQSPQDFKAVLTYIFHSCMITPCFDDGTRWTNITQRTSHDRRHNRDLLVVVFSSSNSHLPSPHTKRPYYPPALILLLLIPRSVTGPSQDLSVCTGQHKHGHADKYACPQSDSNPLSRQSSGGRLDALALGATVIGMFSTSFYHISLEDSHFILNPSIAHQHFRDL